MGRPKHPLYWIYSGLILLSIPVLIVLVGLYEKSLSPESPLPSIPPKEVVLHRLAAFDSTASALHLKEVYQAVPAPRSGARELIGRKGKPLTIRKVRQLKDLQKKGLFREWDDQLEVELSLPFAPALMVGVGLTLIWAGSIVRPANKWIQPLFDVF